MARKADANRLSKWEDSMDFAEIRRIVDELAGSAASEIKVETGGMKIHLRLADAAPVAVPVSAATPRKGAEAVTAPMPGVVYLSPSPGTAPFASTGARVASGDTLLLLEAMKSMLPVCAPFDAVVDEILVSDEIQVEIGQPLIRLRPVSA